MKLALLNLYRMVMPVRHMMAVFLFTLGSLTIKAQCPPTVVTTPVLTNVCSGDSVLMECTPSTGTTWQWYKDGLIIPGKTNCTFYAFDAGNYTVKVAGCATSSVPVPVTIKPLPFVSIFSNTDTLCAGQQVTLSVTTGPNVVWAWISPISIIWTQTNPLVAYPPVTTTYQIMGASNITNCANTAKVTVVVQPPLIPGTANSNQQICPGETPALITANASTGGSGTYHYQWQVRIPPAGYTDIPGANGLTYQPGVTTQTTWYRLVTTSHPCQDEYSNVVVIQVNPNPTITSPSTKEICSGENVNYNPWSNVAGASFTWTASATGGTSVSGFSASGSGNINDILSLPAGSTISGQVTYVITPLGPPPTNCPGIPKNAVVTVNPIPSVTNAILSQDICAGTFSAPVILTSNIAGSTFSWTAAGTAGLSGYQASGTGNIVSTQIFSTLLFQGTVKYTITPHGPSVPGCDGPTLVYTINVNPSPIVTNNPMLQTICTEDKTAAVTLTSNIASTTFTWTAMAVPATMTGYLASGTGTIPAQTITNNSTIQGIMTYHIIPSNSPSGCLGIPDDYIVKVNPKPVASVVQSVVNLCSGSQTNIALSSNVAGTTFSWIVKNFGSVTGQSDGSGNLIAQTLYNNSNAAHPVEYDIIPSFNGCDGDKITVTVIVNPKQLLTLVPSNPVVCSGNNVTINLVGNEPSIAFAWTASTSGNVTGFSDGTGNIISQTLTNNESTTRTVVYAVTMELNGCSDGPVNFNVIVYPTPAVTNSPLAATRCSGTAFNLALTSDVTGTSYIWISNGIGTSGYSSGSGGIINQIISTTSPSTGSVIYTITPTANGCSGTPVDYTLTVNPIPSVALGLSSQSICTGTTTNLVTFNPTVSGTLYAWTAVPSGGGITGYIASGTTPIPAQVINSTLLVPGSVTYTVTPTYKGCSGPTASHLVTINPTPVVSNASMSQTICSGATSSNVVLFSNVAGSTFSWTATPSSPAISGYQPAGGNNIPVQTISNSGVTPGIVTYTITPTSNYSPSCPGTPADYTITINPNPSINSSLAESVCSGQPFAYSITSNIAGSTFTWSRAWVSGISNAPVPSSSMASINETLLNTTNNDIDVTYVLMPFGQAPTLCPGTPKNLVVKVKALPQVNAGTDFTIPYGTYTSLSGTATGGTGVLSYAWTPNSYINTGAGTLTPQTEKLTLTRTYTLSVTDASGCSANDPITVFVVGTPVTASPTAVPASICLGQGTSVFANASGGSGTYTYSWTSAPAGFASTSASAPVSPLVNTVYTVTVNDGFNSATASVSVTVNPLPTQFVLTGGGSYCLGGSGVVVGLAGSQSGVTYQLYNNATPVGSPVSGSGAAISFGNQTLAGIYSVVATRVSTGCTINMGSSVAVSINPLPIANAGVDQLIPYGTSTTLSGSSSGGFGTINYSWIPLTYISTGENTSAPYTNNLYSNTTFTLAIKDANGCTASDQVSVSLNGNAISIAAASIPAEICADASTAQLPASVTGGSGIYTFSWTCSPAGSPAWTSTLQNPIVSPDVTTIYNVTANDGFNTATASVTVVVNQLPLQYSVIGGGSYCYAGNGVSIGLSGSQPNINYQLYRGGVADGPAVTGTGSPISFGNRTAAFNYTVTASNNFTGCTNLMNGSATIIILPPPGSSLVTGGGSYPSGGIGREIGLFHGDAGVNYQLFCDNVAVGTPVTGSGTEISFGLQTQPGTYTIEGTDIATGCRVQMNASVEVTILPYPLVFKVYGGGVMCDGQPGKFVHLSGSEISIDYQLLRNGFPYGALVPGTDAPLTWGPFTVDGLFEVRSVNSTLGITKMMNDSAVIIVHPAPTLYTMNPTGTQCPGTIIRLNGSESGLLYILLYNDVPVDTIAGTGAVGFLDYGPQTISGTYTVKAVNPVTGCDAMMNGSTFISIAPKIFNVIPAGILCPGQTISLSGSETGVNYQLRRNGTFDLGSPVAGTGFPINVGVAGLPGIYSVIATNAITNCVSYMNDSSTLYADPTAFTITPDATACEGELIGLNGSEVGVDYVLLLDNAIHVDTISGTGSPMSFGAQLTAGNYTVIAVNQTSYCIFPMNGTTVMNDSPIKYAVIPAGIQCIGTTVSLSNSQTGITYQLLLDGKFNMGPAVAGNGSSISFGSQSLSGTYTVRAVNDLTGCNTFMDDSTVINPLPLVFTTTPAGSHCSGTSIGLNGSEINFNYILVLNGSIHVDTIAGTGNAIDFGAKITGGGYTVIAYNTTSLCSNLMNGNSIIEPAPYSYAMTPSGIACIGSALGVVNSEPGIDYQLRWNGSINVGNPIAGNGSAISFGTQNLIGTYTVIATNANGCFSTMGTSVTLNPLPVAFNLIPAGIQCQGTTLGLDGSEVNVNYILVRNGNVMTDTIPGTGSTISFGPQFTSGDYTVVAFFESTYCQSVMNGSSTISNIAPNIFSMIPAGIICAGATIGINNSEIGASYQLRMNGNLNVGAPVAGTGSPINFGVQTLPGVYTSIATNLKGCSSLMTGSVVLNPNPVAYTVTPVGAKCPGTEIGTNGSETGVNYILVLDGSILIDTLAGNGLPLSFGTQSTSGTYTILANNAVTLCQTLMNGSTVINPAPLAFNLNPSGINCTSITIGLDDSENGVTYQLRRDGITNVGASQSGTGSAISFGSFTIAGTYTVIATNSVSGCGIIMNGAAVLQPLPVAYTIMTQGKQCAGTSVVLNGSQPGTDYVLVQDNTFNLDTITGTGNIIDFGPQNTTGTYTILAIGGASTCQAMMNGFTLIQANPAAFNITPAGLNCGSAIAGLDGSETGISYTLFKNGSSTGITVTGTGNPITFGTQSSGNYTVEAVNQTSNCKAFMPGTLQISEPPSVNIGSDATICASQAVMINASVENGGTATWSTSGGDGIFHNSGTLHPMYTPGLNDIATGKVMLLLTINGTGTCSTIKVTDTLGITIDKPATANAGGDIDVCIASDYTIHASATDYKTVTWSTSGTGNFVNGGSVTPTYIPSVADLAAGFVNLTMLVTAKDACGNITSDDVLMTFHPVVAVNAGPGAIISHFNTFTATTASVQNSNSVQWSTNGSGTFDKASNLNATYSPSGADYANGSVILTLTAFSQAPCGPVADTLTLRFINNWGADYTWNPSCEATPVHFKVSPGVTNIAATSSWLWNFGDGSTSSLMNPTHLFPGIGEYNVSLTATDTLGIVKSITHHITVSQYPVSFFGSSNPNCSNEPVHFNDLAHTLYGYIAEWRWNYGDGSANDTIQFPDQPNVSHLFNSAGTYNVTLSITNSFGCTTETTLPVDVIEAPKANFQNVDYCSGLETSFRDASYANGPGNTVQYWWNFGDPSTGTDNYSDKKDATHIFSATGTYHVMHIVRNFNSCTDTIIKTVYILDQIPVDFVHGFTCIDGKTNFGPDTTVMNSAAITSWEWDFGDGVSNNQQNTTHVFTQPGIYDVKLTVIDTSGCKTSKTHTVVVNQLPVALFQSSQLSCENTPVHFDDISNTYASHIIKRSWDFGDGNTKQILQPANPDTDHTYSVAGTYTVTLTITSSDSCTAISQQTIVINRAPVANFDFTNGCQSALAQFNDLSQTSGAGMITSWSWNFGDGASGIPNTSVLQNPTHYYAKTGDYKVSLMVTTANGCSSVNVKTVKIAAAPFVDFGFDKHCAEAVIQFSPTAGVIAASVSKWEWSFGDGSYSGEINPQHTFNPAGNYDVTLIITNTAGCQSSISHTIIILPAPVANISTSVTECAQHEVTFTNQSTDPAGNIVRWEYNFGDGTNTIVNFPENPNVTHSYATAGTFIASLTVITENSCSATTSHSIQILPGPLANFGTSASCLGSAVQFSDLSQGNVESWVWDFGDQGSGANNTSTLQNPSHTYLHAGNFTITLDIENASGCHNTFTRILGISGRPATDFSFNSGCASDTVHFNSSASIDVASASSYFWDFGDNSTSVDANPYHIYASPGIYFVSLTLTNKNGCTNVKTRKVQVTTAPIAMFTHTSLSCSGTAVLFTDFSSSTSGIIESWNWNFDDGTTLTINAPDNPNVTHTFAVAGFYEVTLTIRTSTGCYASQTSSIKTNTAPETEFTYINGCNNTPTQFTDQTQTAGGYAISGRSWNFGDPDSGNSNSSTLENPQHTFTGQGTYNVTLTTENSEGCTNSVTHTININPVKNLNFTQSTSCTGIASTFSVDTTIIDKANILSYNWNFGDGSSASSSSQPSHLFPNPGTYIVTLTITQLSGCQSSISKNITIHNGPVTQFTSNGNCAANQVDFKDISYSPEGEKMVSWAWNFGIPNTTADTSSLQNPSYSYAAAATYNVRLSAMTASGCTAETTMQVVVIDAPTAIFDYVAEPCHNGSVLFMDKSISMQTQITGWNWEFAPGIHSTLQNPVHVFGDADTSYNVKLTVTTANGCTNTVIQKITIPSAMKVAINYTQACFGETTWFSSTLVEPAGATIALYKWNFGDPASGYKNESKLADPQHTFSTPGTYVISLQAVDINNCSTTRFMSITVDALPKSAFIYSGGTCDSLVKFKDLTAGVKIVRWIWKFGDGKSKVVDAPANQNVTHYYAYPGIYEATLITQSEAGCYDTITNIVHRIPCIRAAFAVKSPVVCQKRSMQFTETSECQAPIASWQWFFGDGTSQTFTSPQPVVEHTYATAGSYNVKMVVATQMVGGMATDTARSQVAVNPAAKAAYAFQDACSGNATVFDNLTQNNNTTIKSYLWNFGNSGSASDTAAATNPKYNYKLAGEYNVKLVVTNTLGCTDTIAKKVTIFASPAADFKWNTECEAKPVHFSDISEAASVAITNWNWKFSSEAQILDTPTKKSCNVSFAHAGTYDANLIVTDHNGCSTLVTKQITIKSSPVAAFSIADNYENKQGQVLINNGTMNGTDYEWDFGNGKTSTAEAPIVTFDREGHYTIQLIAWNGPSCADTLTMAYDLMFKGLYVPNALNPGNMDPEVAVFRPKGVNLKSYLVEIYDRWGTLLWSSTRINSKGSPEESWEGTLHGEALKEGVYVWKIAAQFNDGEVWDGTNSGNNQNMPQKKSGTVTLIR